jgi:hypothetical protein
LKGHLNRLLWTQFQLKVIIFIELMRKIEQ